jgi:hypothetical protein
MVLLELSPGDIADRVSILKIKNEYISDPKKLEHVRNELYMIEKHVTHDITQLENVNRIIWDIENEIRLCELNKDFGPYFVRLARLVYLTNDRRASIKHKLNLDSKIAEEKQYTEYMNNPKETIGVLTHMGMGDHFVCNGMIRQLSKLYNIITFVKKQNLKSVQYMFRDLGPHVTFVPVENDQEAWDKQEPVTIRTGIFFGPGWDTSNIWCESFYMNAGLDPSIMREEFFVLRSRDREQKFYRKVVDFLGSDKYIIVHDDKSRYENEINVHTDLPIVRINKGEFPIESDNIFDYCTLIEKAVEYHGFDSSFAWLIELMKLRPIEKTFMHRYVRGYCSQGKNEFNRFITIDSKQV